MICFLFNFSILFVALELPGLHKLVVELWAKECGVFCFLFQRLFLRIFSIPFNSLNFWRTHLLRSTTCNFTNTFWQQFLNFFVLRKYVWWLFFGYVYVPHNLENRHFLIILWWAFQIFCWDVAAFRIFLCIVPQSKEWRTCQQGKEKTLCWYCSLQFIALCHRKCYLLIVLTVAVNRHKSVLHHWWECVSHNSWCTLWLQITSPYPLPPFKPDTDTDKDIFFYSIIWTWINTERKYKKSLLLHIFWHTSFLWLLSKN